MKWAAHAEWLAEVTDENEPLPQPLRDKPDLMPEAAPYLEAFWSLAADRQTGMEQGPITFAAIDRYADRQGIIDPDEFNLLEALTRAMDAAYLSEPKPGSA